MSDTRAETIDIQRDWDLSEVTRFEVINHAEGGQGRELVKYGVNVEFSFQDDHRTLKVFLTDRNTNE